MSAPAKSPEKAKFFYSPAGITVNVFGLYRAVRGKFPESIKNRQIKEIEHIVSDLEQGSFPQPYNGRTDIDVKDEAVTVTSANFDRKTKQPFTLETKVSKDAEGNITSINQVNARRVLDGDIPGVSAHSSSYNVVNGEGSLDLRDAIAELRRAQHTIAGTTPRPVALRVH